MATDIYIYIYIYNAYMVGITRDHCVGSARGDARCCSARHLGAQIYLWVGFKICLNTTTCMFVLFVGTLFALVLVSIRGR
jgi:hypothetical protein